MCVSYRLKIYIPYVKPGGISRTCEIANIFKCDYLILVSREWVQKLRGKKTQSVNQSIARYIYLLGKVVSTATQYFTVVVNAIVLEIESIAFEKPSHRLPRCDDYLRVLQTLHIIE